MLVTVGVFASLYVTPFTSTRSLLTPTLVLSLSCHLRLLFAVIKDNCSPQHVANSVQSIVRSSLLQIPGTKRRFRRSSQV